MRYQNIREEELKNKVGADFFTSFDTTKIVGNIDFCVTHKIKNTKQNQLFENDSLLWAEAKRGTFDILTMVTQLVLTIGKARTFDKFLPPAFLGAFDSQKIGFVPYNAIMEVFSMNDFNWNVAPSNHETKEFKLIKEKIYNSLHQNHYVYDFLKDEKELQFFIKNNIAKATESGKILIDKNNFVPIYLRWLDQVKPSIDFNWADGRKQNILDSDFYIADLFVDDKGTNEIEDDTPLNENLFVVFKNSHYEIAKENIKQIFDASIQIKDKKAYEQFWKKYKRPPLSEIQHHIVDRKDLLIPQDIRERKGAFFTPKKWVELSQQYIADVLGDDWQDEYYVWDCAAGTGNLLAGLTNKYNIWASTLDQSDVNAMHDRIENGAILLKDHVFQFDFLNDDFSKLPQGLQDIINDEEKRKKLVVYINPPYAEVSSKAVTGKVGVNQTKTHTKYTKVLGTAGRELYAQFLCRIFSELHGSIIGEFSTLKMFQGTAFENFRNYFKVELKKMFLVPASTFDNVKGSFPIGFKVWDTNSSLFKIENITDVYDMNGDFIQNKSLYILSKDKIINKWISLYKTIENNSIGYMDGINGNDFQHNNIVYVLNSKSQAPNPRGIWINSNNLTKIAIYFAVRKSLDATWLNDRDQFLYPNDGWQSDLEFQNDCLTFTLFNTNIQSKFGTNHWIPFTEQEVNAREKFESNFMTQFIKGKIKQEPTVDLFSSTVVIPTQEESHQENNIKCDSSFVGLESFARTGEAMTNGSNKPLEFSEKATNVFNAGKALWNYYHAQPNVNVNASLYDIREHFQGRNEAGKMNNKSQDETYMKLISELRDSLKILAKKIEPKVYEYGFLKE